ncbi:MAG: PspA/IM30 family protein [Brasilonema angustatum HA4187-MV1]|jgi:hypothetical protein|nr:PspA/IM30 family protein [Brasilonema angustatum HA4187-MV1]
MGLGERVNRVIKANLNDIAGNFNRIEGEMFIAGGGVAGAGISAMVGNMGLAGMGTAVGIYAPHLIAVGTVTGAAAYGVKKGVENQDPLAVGAAVLGSVGGAGVYATIGNMGLVVAGTGFSIGMAHVVSVGAVVGLGVYGLSKVLDKSDNLNKIRCSIQQSIESTTGNTKHLQLQYKQAEDEIQAWYQVAVLALKKERLDLAREALNRKYIYQETAKSLKNQIDQLLRVIRGRLKTLEGQARSADSRTSGKG